MPSWYYSSEQRKSVLSSGCGKQTFTQSIVLNLAIRFLSGISLNFRSWWVFIKIYELILWPIVYYISVGDGAPCENVCFIFFSGLYSKLIHFQQVHIYFLGTTYPDFSELKILSTIPEDGGRSTFVVGCLHKSRTSHCCRPIYCDDTVLLTRYESHRI